MLKTGGTDNENAEEANLALYSNSAVPGD
jgi:hypothetical protein